MKLNDKGSVTIFVVIIFMAIIMTFGMYLNDSVNDLTENNVMRVAQNTSRNVQASYVPKLYQSYGLLAYTKESAEDELWLSLETGLSDNLGIGLLPYHFADTFEYRIEKTEDMSTLKSVFEQMTRQAKFHVPEEFIENQEIVGDIFKKAKAARKKIEKIEGLTDGLSELKKLNDQLGSSLNGFKSFKNKIKVEVSKKGELELQSKRLEYEIEKLEKTMAEAINELQSLNKDVDLEKNQLLLESDSYPDGFVESMKEQLGEMITEGGTLFTSCFNVKGVSSDGADLTRYTNEYLDKYGLEKNLVATKLIENYAEGILDFKTLCDEIQMLEDHYYERYKEDLELIDETDEDKKSSINDLEDEIEDMLEKWLDAYDLEIDELTKPSTDNKLKSYVESVQKEKLHSGATAKQAAQLNLSDKRLTYAEYKELPSQNKNNTQFDASLIEHVLLTEYLLGTFKHRLSDTWNDAKNTSEDGKTTSSWDFYNKFERNAYFNDGEIEYIIAGLKDESENRAVVATEIYLLREAANLTHVYTCKDKRLLASDLSVVLAWPPWTKPIIYHGLLVGWASIESGVDLDKLLNGHAIPTIKLSEEDWFTSFVPDKSKNPTENMPKKVTEKDSDKSSSNIQNYEFYIRLILNANKGKDAEYVGRALDVIKMNEADDSFNPLDLWTGHIISVGWGEKSVVIQESY